MGYRVRWTNCGKCQKCQADKSSKNHGPYLLVRQTVDGKRKTEHIGRWGPKPPLPEQKCGYCGKKFTPKTAWQSYCRQSCRQKSYLKRREQFPEFYSGEPPQKTSKQTVKKKPETTQPPAQPAPAEAPITASAPTLATALLAVIEQWQQAYGLSQQEFESTIEEVWQQWQPS